MPIQGQDYGPAHLPKKPIILWAGEGVHQNALADGARQHYFSHRITHDLRWPGSKNSAEIDQYLHFCSFSRPNWLQSDEFPKHWTTFGTIFHESRSGVNYTQHQQGDMINAEITDHQPRVKVNDFNAALASSIPPTPISWKTTVYNGGLVSFQVGFLTFKGFGFYLDNCFLSCW